MWFRSIIFALACFSCGFSSNCVKNAFINELDLVQPAPLSLVPTPYYTKLSAEIQVEPSDFNEKQHEFYLCVRSVVEIEGGVEEVFSECGRSVFGQGAVHGVQGINHVYTTLYHNDTILCAVNTSVVCCLDAETSAAMAAKRAEASFVEFLALGTEMVEQIKPMGIMKDADRSPSSRIHHMTALRTEYASKHHVNVLVGIKSSALNLVKRNNIRSTWLRETEIENADDFHFLPFFLVGDSHQASLNSTVQEILQLEYAFYEDVLLSGELGVEDSYFTLGEKVLSFAQWSLQRLRSSEWDIGYVVVCDDDVFVDIWQLKQHILRLDKSKSYYAGEV